MKKRNNYVVVIHLARRHSKRRVGNSGIIRRMRYANIKR